MRHRLRSSTAVVAIAIGLTGTVGTELASARDKDCGDFKSRKQAQKYFKKHGGSKSNNVDNLDADGDGKVCEDYDY